MGKIEQVIFNLHPLDNRLFGSRKVHGGAPSFTHRNPVCCIPVSGEFFMR